MTGARLTRLAIALTLGMYYSVGAASPVDHGVNVEVLGGSPNVAAQVEAAALNAMAGLPPFLVASVKNIRVRIEPVGPEPCPIRGFASLGAGGQGSVTLYLDSVWDQATVDRIVAHEIAHVFHFSQLQPLDRPKGDGILREGFATWLAGPIWFEALGFSSFEAASIHYRREGAYLSLVHADELNVRELGRSPDECLALRDMLYTVWAGFVDFLVTEYGIQTVIEASAMERVVLPQSEESISLAPLDYETGFGKSLQELEEDWTTHLDQQMSGASPSVLSIASGVGWHTE